MNSAYPAPNVIYVDLDGMLDLDGVLNTPLVQWLDKQRAAGQELILWSMRGAEYAAAVATRHGVADKFSACLSKPGIMVDDRGTRWLRFVKVITPDYIARKVRAKS